MGVLTLYVTFLAIVTSPDFIFWRNVHPLSFPRNADYPYLTNIQVEDFSYLAPEYFARFAGSSHSDFLTKVPPPTRLSSSVKMSERDLRKDAYRYVLERLCKLPVRSCNVDRHLIIPLNELRLLKEGLADPSEALVASLKQLFKGTVTEAEIGAHLVAPFEKQN